MRYKSRPQLAAHVRRAMRVAALIAVLFLGWLTLRSIPDVARWIGAHQTPWWTLPGTLAFVVGMIGFAAVWLLAIVHAALAPQRAVSARVLLPVILVVTTPLGALVYAALDLVLRQRASGPLFPEADA